MRKMNGFLTALLIMLSFAGLAWAAIFLRSEQKLSEARQMEVSRLSDELAPIQAERKALQDQDKEWQNTLTEEKGGKPCILLVFDTMDTVLYESMFDMMDQYGFRGTFVMQEERFPGDDESTITYEEFEEIMRSGWEYALEIPDQEEQETETEESFQIHLNETEESETEEPETEAQTEDHRTYLQKLDDSLAALDERGFEKPVTLVCSKEQYESFSDAAVAKKGIQMACVFTSEEFPVIGEMGENLWKIDGGIFKQRDLNLEESIGAAVEEGNSMVITINDVVKISRDPLYDLSVTKFSSLMNYLKELEEQGMINVLTFSELYQYEEQQEQAYEELISEYRDFRLDMEEQLEELDRREQVLVDSARMTEAQ